MKNRVFFCFFLLLFLSSTESTVDNYKIDLAKIDWTFINRKAMENYSSMIIKDDGSYTISGNTYEKHFDNVPEDWADSFIDKYNNSNEILWSKMYGTYEVDECSGMTIDSKGNTYFVVTSINTLFDKNEDSLEENCDGYLVKIDKNGEIVWIETISGGAFDGISAITIYNDKYLYIAGESYAYIDGIKLYDDEKMFLAKYDLDGKKLWMKFFTDTEGGSVVSSNDLAVDSNEDIYVLLRSYIPNLNGVGHIYLLKYDKKGNLLWVKQYGSGEQEYSTFIAVDKKNNIYITGRTYGDFYGNPVNVSSSFLLNLDSNGEILWSRTIVSDDESIGVGILIDNFNDVYLLSEFLYHDDYKLNVTKFSETGNVFWNDKFLFPESISEEKIEIEVDNQYTKVFSKICYY